MTWDTALLHVNIQFLPDLSTEFFAEDLKTGKLWSEERMDEEFPEILVHRLEQVY
jgi:hypothetical protein